MVSDTLMYMVEVCKKGRAFEATRYFITHEGSKASEDKKLGNLQEVRLWIKQTFPNLVRFPKDEHDDPVVSETWY